MDDLVETLVTGLIVSILVILITYYFWKQFDKPSEKAIERMEEKAKAKHERKMWAAVEAQMREEAKVAEEQAIFERREAEKRERARAPEAAQVNNALQALGLANTPAPVSQEPKPSFGDEPKSEGTIQFTTEGDLVEQNDTDLDVDETLEVRIDSGYTMDDLDEKEPDWELVGKLRELNQGELIEDEQIEALPSAPDLDSLVQGQGEELPQETEEQTEPEQSEAIEKEDDVTSQWVTSAASEEAEEVEEQSQEDAQEEPQEESQEVEDQEIEAQQEVAEQPEASSSPQVSTPPLEQETVDWQTPSEPDEDDPWAVGWQGKSRPNSSICKGSSHEGVIPASV